MQHLTFTYHYVYCMHLQLCAQNWKEYILTTSSPMCVKKWQMIVFLPLHLLCMGRKLNGFEEIPNIAEDLNCSAGAFIRAIRCISWKFWSTQNWVRRFSNDLQDHLTLQNGHYVIPETCVKTSETQRLVVQEFYQTRYVQMSANRLCSK